MAQHPILTNWCPPGSIRAPPSATCTSRSPTSIAPRPSYQGVLGFALTGRLGDQTAFVAAGDYHHHIGLDRWKSRGGSPPPPGTTGLYHVAIRYPPRAALAGALRAMIERRYPMCGAADHAVSEAIYLRDFDGNGIEIYWDWPRDAWPVAADGGCAMVVEPLDLGDLLAVDEDTS